MLPRNTGKENIQTFGSPLGFSEAPGVLGFIQIPIADFFSGNLEGLLIRR